MGLIVCSYMYSLSPAMGQPLGLAVIIGVVGAVIGSLISTRLMLGFTKKVFGTTAKMVPDSQTMEIPPLHMRPVRSGGLGRRIIDAILEGGHGGVLNLIFYSSIFAFPVVVKNIFFQFFTSLVQFTAQA